MLSGPLFSDALFNNADTLKEVRASFNNFTGSIPENLGELTKLRQLWIAKNDLNGSIPKTMTALTRLSKSLQKPCKLL